MRIIEAYKLGDVQSGNWQWAVGIRNEPPFRHSNLATINTIGALRNDLDPEDLAQRIAATLQQTFGS